MKIVDFGVARVLITSEETATMNTGTQGIVAGTPDYMSPEQFQSADMPDASWDLWAVGVRWELSKPPF